jgi:hypothetical protein
VRRRRLQPRTPYQVVEAPDREIVRRHVGGPDARRHRFAGLVQEAELGASLERGLAGVGLVREVDGDVVSTVSE